MWEIVDALGSLLSALLAGVAGVVAFLIYRIESMRDEETAKAQQRRDRDARRQQAAAVGFWEEWDEETLYEVTAFNHSALPIYDVVINAETTREAYGDADEDVRAQVDLWSSELNRGVPVVKPGAAFMVKVASPPGFFPALDLFMQMIGTLRLTFTDNAGVTWTRQLQGELVEREP